MLGMEYWHEEKCLRLVFELNKANILCSVFNPHKTILVFFSNPCSAVSCADEIEQLDVRDGGKFNCLYIVI
jgi:hypothetical protein